MLATGTTTTAPAVRLEGIFRRKGRADFTLPDAPGRRSRNRLYGRARGRHVGGRGNYGPMKGWEVDEDPGVSPPRERSGRAKRLVELKARLAAPEDVERRLLDHGATHVARLRQIDTYFDRVLGRLKLRRQRPGADQLVHYDRPDRTGPKGSEVRVADVPPESGIGLVLSHALGVVAEVTKDRDVYDWHGTRVHLDRVQHLGTFVEFERRVGPDDSEPSARSDLLRMLGELGIEESALVSGSYADLLREGRP